MYALGVNVKPTPTDDALLCALVMYPAAVLAVQVDVEVQISAVFQVYPAGVNVSKVALL